MADPREGGFVFSCQFGSGESSSSILLLERAAKLKRAAKEKRLKP